MSVLDLVIPALLAPAEPSPGRARERLPALETLLVRADRTPLAGCGPDILLHLFGVTGEEEQDLPVGPFCLLGDGGEPGTARWCRVDPVHLLVDQDKVYLAAAESLDVARGEADALVDAFNRLFAEDGLELLAPTPVRWYLRLADDEPLQTTPLHRVIGAHVGHHLPRGGGMRWHAFLNEVQMLFHGQPANREREARGQPAINSIWPWGAGRLRSAEAAYEQVWTGDCLARGLGLAAGAPVAEVPASLPDIPAGRSLMYYDRLASAPEATGPQERGELRRELEQQWLAPALAALRAGRLAQLRLFPGDGFGYTLDRRRLRRFWRRRRPLPEAGPC